MLIDTHSHLYWDTFKNDFDQVIQRCIDSEVKILVNVGVDIDSSKTASLLENDMIKFYSTIGIHPHEAQKYKDLSKLTEDLNNLEKIFLNNPKKVVAVGECGLDFLFHSNPDHKETNMPIEDIKNLQRLIFQKQIELAEKLNLPLVIHCRDDRSKNPQNIECWLEVLEKVKKQKGILHCYSGTMIITKKIPDNFYVSFAGTLTYPKNDHLKEAAITLPLERLVLETDCPFLPPQSKRGQRNEPSSVKEIAQTIANLKNISLAEVSEKTSANAKKVFNIG